MKKAFLAATILIATAAPVTAVAGPEADRDKAVEYAQAGQDALDKQDYQTALDKFTQANAIIHAPTLMVGIGRAQVGLHHLVAASETYKRILKEGNPDPKKPVFVQAMKDAQSDLDALTPRIPTIAIKVKGGTASTLTLDGAALDPSAIGAKTPVDPGKHHIHAASSAGGSADADVSVAESANESATLDLTPTGANPNPTPQPAPESSSGMSGQRIAGISLMAVGGVGIIVGAATGGVAVSKHGKLKDECPGGTCSTAAAINDLGSYHTMGVVSTVGLVVGLAAAGAGVVVFVTAPKTKPATAAHVSPMIGLGYAGIDGTF